MIAAFPPPLEGVKSANIITFWQLVAVALIA